MELVDESIDVIDLFAVHAYAVAYLLACAGVGLLASVAFESARRAQTVGAGSVFGLFLLDTFTFDTDYEWLGDIAFSRYFDPGAILVAGDVSWADLAVLSSAVVVLVVASSEYFERQDLAG
ncbi:hypothetical protein [Natrinema salifodinae]|uniref:ABC-2 type transport system permease protein n=1 Tax=Natrinema salifodinae TaxID=1202768 RepID=A0A1I0QV94_9EURY|nr:hypothetical protein [Natrinema salifodinae]SEW31384.1 ABC-2 type transport system permease protein [Natrinema salifodinae]